MVVLVLDLPLIKFYFFHFVLSLPVGMPRDVVFLNSSVIRSQVEAFLATSGFIVETGRV